MIGGDATVNVAAVVVAVVAQGVGVEVPVRGGGAERRGEQFRGWVGGEEALESQ